MLSGIDSLGPIAGLVATDPNWFYSTLAQATAAIVGLAGGFLATRLIAHRGVVAESRDALRGTFLVLLSQAEEKKNLIAGLQRPLTERIAFIDAHPPARSI